ncbi:MAG: thiol:disulfide interchange protein [Acidithiobacillales bacterium SG8_45]|nr:MAG: thiol:disulfide interchange protein [Acidithiobacillales bacterium SG8_45]
MWKGLSLDPKHIPSPLIGKALPDFTLARVHQPTKKVSPKDLYGRVYLLNVWASWCVACRQEHPLLMEIGRSKLVPLIGLNYKDKNDDALGFLAGMGDPYEISLSDTNGRVGIDLGVYGVPETFVIDKQGIIRYKHIGPIDEDALQNKIMPVVRQHL